MNPEPGWYRDPYFLNHERYWDNGWTDQIRRVEPEKAPLEQDPAGGPEQFGSMAEITAERPPPATDATRPGDAASSRVGGLAGAAGVGLTAHSRQRERVESPPTATYPAVARGVVAPAGGDAQTLPSRSIREDDTLVVPALDDVVDTGEVPAVRPPADTDMMILPTVRKNAASSEPPWTRSAEQVLLWDSSNSAQEETLAMRTRTRRRRLGFVAAGLACVVLAVVATEFAIAGGGNGRPANGGAAAPAAAPSVTGAGTPTAAPTVQEAASRSATKKTAVVTVTLVPVNATQSTSLPQSGSGEFVLASGLGSLGLTPSSGTATDQKFLFQGQVVYVNVSDSPVPGKSWVVASTNDLPALGPGSELSNLIEMIGDPGLLLHELASTPLSVASVGSSTVNGRPVQVYQVNFNSNPAALSAAGFGSHIGEEVDVGADGHVRQIVIPGPQISVSGQAVQENVVVVFTHYGTPLSVTTPPFSQMIPLSRYLTRPPTASSSSNVSGNS